ncbi:hypothetical protein COLO4_18791 [Corchorus olitorius]|uniref:Uncharacterized protein n=1 Tax=Corchorus olitorius TaxID=93759 RepID=A0A1R3J7U0_9ROSI|nr:hypothetical protein COLO4_18791 [Corchorus olitorius]
MEKMTPRIRVSHISSFTANKAANNQIENLGKP